jgi:hypothetical protein
MSWTTALDDLRLLLNDGPTDKIRAFKRVFGDINGVNDRFKTYEFRRITNFKTEDDASSLGVYLDGGKVSNVYLSSDDPTSGFFIFDAAYLPGTGQVVEATYYVQYFLDPELQSFLRLAQNWLGYGDDYTTTPQGLRPALLQYATGEGYQKLAMRFSEHSSETYRLEDMPDVRRTAMVAEYKNAGAQAKEQAHTLRNEFYSRQGQHLSPLFGVLSPTIRDVAPRR